MKTMSNYWTVFGVVSALIVCLVLEVSIVNVSGFSTPHNSAIDIPIFSALSVFSIIAQLIILNFVYTRNVPFEKTVLRIMYKAMMLTQLAIIIILLIILIEINFTLSYYLVHLELVFMISSVTAVAVMGLLSYKFITWLRLNKSGITFVYLLASLSLSINAAIGIIYVSDQFSYVSDIIQPSPYAGVIMHTHYSSLAGRYFHTFLVGSFVFITKLSEKARDNKVLDNHVCSITLLSKSIPTRGDKYAVRL